MREAMLILLDSTLILLTVPHSLLYLPLLLFTLFSFSSLQNKQLAIVHAWGLCLVEI